MEQVGTIHRQFPLTGIYYGYTAQDMVECRVMRYDRKGTAMGLPRMSKMLVPNTNTSYFYHLTADCC